MILDAKRTREKIPKSNFDFSSGSLYQISRLPKSQQKNVLSKVKKGEIKPSDIQSFVSSVKKMPSDMNRIIPTYYQICTYHQITP